MKRIKVDIVGPVMQAANLDARLRRIGDIRARRNAESAPRDVLRIGHRAVIGSAGGAKLKVIAGLRVETIEP